MDKDKNRSCRSHNREKFLRQLYEDVKPNQKINLAVGAELSTGDSNNSQDNDQKLFNAEKMGLRSAPVTGYSETSKYNRRYCTIVNICLYRHLAV